ncbi:MAG: hypothetical protein NTZ53_01290 [Cyanobacteria bacterium]|nr:hypothetical protein [Cyanobacteriota bacterium]
MSRTTLAALVPIAAKAVAVPALAAPVPAAPSPSLWHLGIEDQELTARIAWRTSWKESSPSCQATSKPGPIPTPGTHFNGVQRFDGCSARLLSQPVLCNGPSPQAPRGPRPID